MAAATTPSEKFSPPKPALHGLQDDERVVVSGDRVVRDLEQSGQLRVYASATDVDDLIADYGLRRVRGDRVPNAIVWAVSDLDAVPRDPHPCTFIHQRTQSHSHVLLRTKMYLAPMGVKMAVKPRIRLDRNMKNRL